MKESISLILCRKFLNKEVKVIIDRPLNSFHPKHGFKYETNYGFIEGIIAPDGEELDAYYLGINKAIKSAKGICIAIIHRIKDDDDKLIVVPQNKKDMTDEEISKVVNFQEKWFESKIIRK